MAVKIRLKRMGTRKRPFFRIVAADERSPRDGRFIESLGYYNPMVDPPQVKIDDDKVFKWLDNGALMTDNTAQLLRSAGLLERWQLLKSGVQISELDGAIEARRAKQPRAEPKTGTKPSKEVAEKPEAAEAAAAQQDAAPESPEQQPEQ